MCPLLPIQYCRGGLRQMDYFVGPVRGPRKTAPGPRDSMAMGQEADSERCSIRDVVLRTIPSTATGVLHI